jgi:tRNA threonylcarbamoyladenosine modification (KEOPS) complex  Pcc1 subunit
MTYDNHTTVEVSIIKDDEDTEGKSKHHYLLLRSLYHALEPECKASMKDVRSSIILDDNRITISIDAYDISVMRAVLNSYIRFISVAYRALEASRF